MNDRFMQKANLARKIANIPFYVVSGFRCWKHNKEIGSTSDNHPLGVAMDVQATTSRQRFIIIDALIKAGFNRIGVHKTFIHFDDNINKTSNVIWLY
ncbi:MAG: D-Ala-D-Ala carboxypeptidase family metallohydrolase [Thermodesulfobacteriota bacterium]|nr:D-Ala-D-Ala carboxypeptidase family metallohydrolase [Thermodesulfobacteriota bacterium]